MTELKPYLVRYIDEHGNIQERIVYAENEQSATDKIYKVLGFIASIITISLGLG